MGVRRNIRMLDEAFASGSTMHDLKDIALDCSRMIRYAGFERASSARL
jgi:hypothetical protein